MQCFVLKMKLMLTKVENEQDTQSWKDKKFKKNPKKIIWHVYIFFLKKKKKKHC